MVRFSTQAEILDLGLVRRWIWILLWPAAKMAKGIFYFLLGVHWLLLGGCRVLQRINGPSMSFFAWHAEQGRGCQEKRKGLAELFKKLKAMGVDVNDFKKAKEGFSITGKYRGNIYFGYGPDQFWAVKNLSSKIVIFMQSSDRVPMQT